MQSQEAGPSSVPLGGVSGDLNELSIDQLRDHLQKIKSKNASIQAEVERVRDIPSIGEMQEWVQSNSKALPENIVNLSKQVSMAEERCILHRTAAWTIFEIDLDIGKRERKMRKEEGISKLGKASLGLGVRLDTFFRGRFYEPYYLIFAKQSQLLENKPKVSGSALDIGKIDAKREMADDDEEHNRDSEDDEYGKEPVRLLRHTIPSFIPLQTLIKRYLGHGGYVEINKRGGFDLIEGMMARDGLTSFLVHLHTHLQALVCRREQTIGLRSIRLPGKNFSEIGAYGNDAFDQITIRWTIPTVNLEDVLEYEKQHGIIHQQDGDPIIERSFNVKRKARYEHKQEIADADEMQGFVRNVEIEIRFNDLISDNLGLIINDHQERNDDVEESDVQNQSDRMTFEHGFVRVEHQRSRTMRYIKDRSKKQYYVDTIRRSDCEKLFENGERQKVGSLEDSVQKCLLKIFSDHLERESESDQILFERILEGKDSERVEKRIRV